MSGGLSTIDPPASNPGGMIQVASKREIAEIQGAMTIAKSFPRDQQQSIDNIITACQRQSLAEVAVYQYSKGGTSIEGPSIRLAEMMAREWGNLHYGVRELEQRDGESTVEAFCIDLEKNVRSVRVFQVKHERHTKSGKFALTDPRDIYELAANSGARRLRSCILSQIPGDVIDQAVSQCGETMNTKCQVTPEKLKSLVGKFAEFKITKLQIETRIQRHLDSMTPAQMVSLGKIYNSLKDGMSDAKDWFPDIAEDATKGSEGLEKKLKAKSGEPATAKGDA